MTDLQTAKTLLLEETYQFFTDKQIEDIIAKEGFKGGIYVLASLKSVTLKTQIGATEEVLDIAKSLENIAEIYRKMINRGTATVEETLKAETDKGKEKHFSSQIQLLD